VSVFGGSTIAGAAPTIKISSSTTGATESAATTITVDFFNFFQFLCCFFGISCFLFRDFSFSVDFIRCFFLFRGGLFCDGHFN
jgi:hypothetical protein